MPEVTIQKQLVLDVLGKKAPDLSSTSDMPVIETTPDVTVAKPAAPEAEKPEAEAGESAPPDKPEDSSATTDEAKKPAKGVQKRIDELIRQREDERRGRDAERQEKLRLLALIEARAAPPQPKVVAKPSPVKPQKSDFDNPEAYDAAIEEYIISRATFVAEEKVREQTEANERQRREERQASEQKRLQEEHFARVAKVKEKYPDWDEFANSPDVQVSIPVSYAIAKSDQGPEIAYYLGKHPDEAKRLLEMTTLDENGSVVPDVARQFLELGQIVSKLNAPSVPAKPVSKAPTPGTPIKAGTESTVSPEEEDMESYAARRRPQLMRRPGAH